MNRAERRRKARNKSGPNKAAIGWIYGDTVSGPFNASLVRTFGEDASLGDRARITCEGGGFISLSSGPMIVASRNNLVRNFMEVCDQADWFVSIDTDMSWDKFAIHRLIDAAEENDYDILGGLCFAASRQTGILYPTIYVADGVQPQTTMPRVRKVLDYPRNALVTCDATGTAFTVISREILQTVFDKYRYYKLPGPDNDLVTCANPHPWYAETYTPTGGYYGEDITFCLRARSVGAKVGVHTGVPIGHVKPKVLSEPEWDVQQAGDEPYVLSEPKL